jgi:hypothetical protein
MRRFTIGLIIAFLIGLIAWIMMGNFMWSLVEDISQKGKMYAGE